MGRVGPPGHAFSATFTSKRRLPPPWTLTAPESYLLRWTQTRTTEDVEGFRLGLLDLVARGALRVDQAWVSGATRVWRRHWLYSWGPDTGDVHHSSLTPLLDIHACAHQRGHWVGFSVADHEVEVHGVRFKDLMYARSFWRASWHGYLKRTVAPSLERRGLVDGAGMRTPAGDAALERLEAWLRLGEKLAWTRNQSWSGSYLAGAGAAALLVEQAVPVIARMRNFDPTINLASSEALADRGLFGFDFDFSFDFDASG